MQAHIRARPHRPIPSRKQFDRGRVAGAAQLALQRAREVVVAPELRLLAAWNAHRQADPGRLAPFHQQVPKLLGAVGVGVVLQDLPPIAIDQLSPACRIALKFGDDTL